MPNSVAVQMVIWETCTTCLVITYRPAQLFSSYNFTIPIRGPHACNVVSFEVLLLSERHFLSHLCLHLFPLIFIAFFFFFCTIYFRNSCWTSMERWYTGNTRRTSWDLQWSFSFCRHVHRLVYLGQKWSTDNVALNKDWMTCMACPNSNDWHFKHV